MIKPGPLLSMANISQDDRDIIAKYPLSNSLDHLQGLLQDAEGSYMSDLNLNDSAINDLSQIYQKVISRLLSTLQGEETAFSLRSKISSRDIASELSDLFKGVRNGNFSYIHYRALLQLIIWKAPDVDIWNAVFDLITTVS